jgi:hypothetical protein
VKKYKGYKIEIADFGDLCELGIRVESDFSFSINLPDKIFCYNTPSSIKNFPYKIYFPNYKNAPMPLESIDFKEFFYAFLDKTRELSLNENEGVFYYANVIHLVLNVHRNIIPIFDDLINLIDNNSLIFAKNKREKIFAKNIPENLRQLIPLLKKWCIADDSEREQLMEETSEKQKLKLLTVVNPYITGINEFLDSFGDEPLSHEAILLGNLAELVSELQITNS